MAHRLEHSLKDVLKKIPLYQKVVGTLLKGLFYFYHNSALNMAMLRNTYKALKQDGEKLLIPTRTDGTRWVGHQLLAVKNVLTSYKFIVGHMEQLVETRERVSTDSKSKAKGFLAMLKSRDIVSFLLFLVDVLSPLKYLSLMLQEEKAVLANQHQAIECTLEAVKKLKSSDGPFLRKLEGKDSYHGIQLTKERVFKFAKQSVLDEVTLAVSKRFSDFCQDVTVVNATKIADLKAWPEDWKLLKDFGDNELHLILEKFGGILNSAKVNVEQAEMEWTMLKKAVNESDLKDSPDWEFLGKKYKQQFPNILAIVDLILTFSPSSAQAERGFSQLRIVKSDLRNRLGQNSLNNILAIKFLSDDIQTFDPHNAIKHFFTTKNRRLSERKRKSVPLNVGEEAESERDDVIVTESSDTVDEQTEEESRSEIGNESETESEYEIDSEDEERVFERLHEMEIEFN